MKIKFYESSKVKCQVVDTAYGGFGIKAHIMDQEERDKIVQSKKDWVKIGVYAVEKKYPHPIDTPLFKDRMIGDIKGSVLSGTRAGDVGENLAVFANHTSFIPNAIMHGHNNNQEHWLMVLKQAVLDGEEIKWSYAQDNPDHHDYHGLEAHYEPNQDDIETVENYSIWERLKSILHGSKPWCQLTHNYVCTVFKNLLQNTPLQFYIEYGMKNKKSQELAKDIIKRIHDNVKRLYPPREGYHVARLKDHPEFINWIRACNWDTMIEHVMLKPYKDPDLRLGTCVTIAQHVVMMLGLKVNNMWQLDHQIFKQCQEEFGVYQLSPERTSGFFREQLLSHLECFMKRHQETHQDQVEILKTYKRVLQNAQGSSHPYLQHTLRKIDSYIHDVIDYNVPREQIQSEAKQDCAMYLYNPVFYPVERVLCSTDNPVSLVFIDPHHQDDRLPNPYFGVVNMDDYWRLQEGVIPPRSSLESLWKWLVNRQDSIDIYLDQIKQGSLITNQNPFKAHLIHALLKAISHYSVAYLYVFWRARLSDELNHDEVKTLSMLSLLTRIVQSQKQAGCSEEENNKAIFNMLICPDFDSAIHNHDWSRLYRWAYEHSRHADPQPQDYKLQFSAWGLGLFNQANPDKIEGVPQATAA